MVAPVRMEDILEASRERTIEGLHTCEPGKVLSYDAAKQTASVQPVNKRRYRDAETGETFYEEKPAIPNVPIAWHMAGGFGLCMPLEAGDHVWIVYAQESISEWREADQTSEPTDAGRLTDSHPFAIPAAFPVGKEFAQTNKAGVFLGHGGGSGLHVESNKATLKVGAGELELQAASAKLKAAVVELGSATPTGVVTMSTLTPTLTALSGLCTALVAFAAEPGLVAIAPSATAMGTAAGTLGTAAAAPANFSQTVKASA